MAKMETSRKIKAQQKVFVGKVNQGEYENGARLYFQSIEKLPTLFIEVKKASEPYVYLDIRNLVVLLIYESYRLDKWTKLCIICKNQVEKKPESKLTILKLKSDIVFQDSTEVISQDNDSNTKAEFNDIFKGSRTHPSITVEDKLMVVCGISSVLRFIFQLACYRIEKHTSDNNKSIDYDTLQKLKQFLGFRGGCLKTCAESSIWTKFCEIDMIASINDITNLVNEEHNIPENLIRFENHLSLPVVAPNIQKIIRDIKKENETVNQTTTATTYLARKFAEGLTLLLSDLILYPCFHIFVKLVGRESFGNLLPKSLEWQDHVHDQFPVNICIDLYDCPSYDDLCELSWCIPVLPAKNLCVRDTNSSQAQNTSIHQFTRQCEIDEAFEYLTRENICSLKIHEEDPNFQWNNIPTLAQPEGGNLPVVRQQRKCEQLASIAYYVLQVYAMKRSQSNFSCNERFRIVDFCSGGGHVGILLAYLLPNCDVILVENKHESLRRAQQRISGIGLSNVFCFQSNLDYFECSFDMGVALHACGTATDLVIEKCVKSNASFVCCPCCYGAVQENHILTYPRSTIFQKLSLRHYFVLCHASDQTEAHEETKVTQGKQCMAMIDTDRCFYATENQYETKLCKIVPENASSKNHILVGISSSKF